MNSIGILVLGLLAVANLVLLVLLLRRKVQLDPGSLRETFASLAAESQKIEMTVRDDLARQRSEAAATASALRGELNAGAMQTRTELRNAFGEFQTAVRDSMEGAGRTQTNRLQDFEKRLDRINETLGQQLDKVRVTVEGKLAELQTRNEQKLEAMRQTVDEKLQGTLEKRLGAQFDLVSKRLEEVHRGLGEMKTMASSVGDLKRVLTNVKTRGTWGEIQLGALLEQTLVVEQYAANVAVNPSSMERVEYAIRLPGRGEAGKPMWLPIDAKFPQEDYQRLVEAAERADAEGVTRAGKALETRMREQAKTVSEKYIAPPHTTDFALMFLPSEGLYAEVLRRPGLAEGLQRDYRVVIAGPTTLMGILNSLQMGFRTLAIEKRSSEVWQILNGFKKEFAKFGEALANVKKKLEQATEQIENTEVRTRAVAKSLKSVESSSEPGTPRLLPEPESVEYDPPGLGQEHGDMPLFPPARP